MGAMQTGFERAAFYYHLLNNPRKATECLMEMADRFTDKGELDQAEKLYVKELEKAMDDDQFYFRGKEMLSGHIKLCLKFKNTREYARIIDTQKKYITYQRREDKFPHLVGRAWQCIAAVHFLWGEPFKVQECLDRMLEDQHSQVSDEFRALDRLLDSYKSGSRHQWEAALRSPVIQNLEKELLKKLKLAALPDAPPSEENKELHLQQLLIGADASPLQAS